MISNPLLKGALMRFTEWIGNPDDYVERHAIKPKYYPCAPWGQKGKRKRVLSRRVQHGAALCRRSWIEAEVGVYQARCKCCKFFQAALPGVPSRGLTTKLTRKSTGRSSSLTFRVCSVSTKSMTVAARFSLLLIR